jgi:hypothetical protein
MDHTRFTTFYVRRFEVYRKFEKAKAATSLTLPLSTNAYGATLKMYEVYDTLREKGNYTYSIYGVADDQVILLNRENVAYVEPTYQPAYQRRQHLRREFQYFSKHGGYTQVLILDSSRDKILFTTNRRSSKGKNTLTFDFATLAAEGISRCFVVVKEKDAFEEFEVNLER